MSSTYAPIIRKIGRMVAAHGLAFELNETSELGYPFIGNNDCQGFLEHSVWGERGHIYITQHVDIKVREKNADRYRIEERVMRRADSGKLHAVDSLVETAFRQALNTFQKRISIHINITQLTGWYAQNDDEAGITNVDFEIMPDGRFISSSQTLDKHYVEAFSTLLDLL